MFIRYELVLVIRIPSSFPTAPPLVGYLVTNWSSYVKRLSSDLTYRGAHGSTGNQKGDYFSKTVDSINQSYYIIL